MHCSEESAIVGLNDTDVVVELLPSVAVITAVCELVTLPAAALKLTLDAPVATFTEEGTVSMELLSARVTVAAAGAASLNVSVQVLTELESRVEGLH